MGNYKEFCVSDLVSHLRYKGVTPDSFAGRVRYARLKRGFSQKSLAKIIGLNRNTIQNYEHGESPKTDNVMAIAKALGFRFSWLMTGEGAEEVEETHTSATPTTARAGPGSVSAEYIPEAADTLRMGGLVEGFGRAVETLSDIFHSRDQDAIRSITAVLEALWASTRRQESE